MQINGLSGEAERSLRLACGSARLLGHSYLGTGHLLLALTQLPATGCLLSEAGVTAQAVRACLLELYGRGMALRKLPQSMDEELQALIGKAAGEAALQKSRKVSDTHLLLALTRTPGTDGYQILCRCGCAPEELFSMAAEQAARQNQKQEESKMQNSRLLDQFGQDMLERVEYMEPVIGRQNEIDTVIGILCRKNKNNPALIGEPGVGKTAIVEGLAQRMAAGNVPEQLFGKRLISIDIASLIAGTKYRGEFEERIRDIVAEVRKNRNVILFVDEMHTLCGAGAAEGAIDASNLLKPALGRGELQMIGATTLDEYRKYIEKDAALERRFRPVTVLEPSQAQSEEILHGLRPGLERHHGVVIADEAVEAAVKLSCRYLTDRFLPDKALDLLDESAAHVRIAACGVLPPKRVHLEQQIHAAVESGNYEKAALLQDRAERMRREGNGGRKVTAEDVAQTLSCRTGIPAGIMNRTERERLAGLEEILHKTLVGQDAAVKAVCDAVRRGKSGLADGKRPIAAILLTGPTGVGKTELCKALAEAVYGSRDAMIRLDMSEYMEKFSVSRLLGAPPGYVGYENGGELTEKVRRRPYSLIVFDELEKAHREVSNLLLQIMEDGVLTDASGRKIDFCNTMLVMTSNLGVGNGGGEIGFGKAAGEMPIPPELRTYFAPEFLGRIDCIAQLRPLHRDELEQIAVRQLCSLKARAGNLGVSLAVSKQAAAFIADGCGSEKSGARQIRHRIHALVENPLSALLLRGEHTPKALNVCVEDQRIVLREADTKRGNAQ